MTLRSLTIEGLKKTSRPDFVTTVRMTHLFVRSQVPVFKEPGGWGPTSGGRQKELRNPSNAGRCKHYE